MREAFQQLNEQVTGHRYLRGFVCPGGVRRDLTPERAKAIEALLASTEVSLADLMDHPRGAFASEPLLVVKVATETDGDGRARALSPEEAAERVSQRVREVLGRSLALRHLDAGSCDGCDWELTTLLNPVFDARRLGIDFVASPRHADGVVVTGPVTRNLEQAARRTFEAVPEPRIVVAVGACASSGGIVGKRYASAGGAAELLPVDVFVPGCPPRPEAIIFGVLLALGRASPPAARPVSAAETEPSKTG